LISALQNCAIANNHTQMDPTYKYRAWYKAYSRIESDSYRIGNLVTPKTDPGDYIIEKTGDITVYAGESVVLKPGFHAQNGSKFHAFIKQDCKQPPDNVPDYGYIPKTENDDLNKIQLAIQDLNLEVITEKKSEEIESVFIHEKTYTVESSVFLIVSNYPDNLPQNLPQQNFIARIDDEFLKTRIL
jgi:hypothetical protein